MSRLVIERYLYRNGIFSEEQINEIVSGFDLTKPVYEIRICSGDRLFQFMRNPSASFNELKTGRWFSLVGASMTSLAIFSGGSGRQLTEFKVNYSIIALEGTAVAMTRKWDWAGGGQGGATQLFIPEKLFYALEVVGTHLS